MTPERWRQVEDVFQAALDCPPPERAALLDEACAGDAELKSEATALIRAYEDSHDFIEQPAIAHDARVLFGEQVNVQIGRIVGSYTILKRLGAGGMGEVYLAQDGRLNRRVALKILPAYFISDEARLRRFQTEARAVSALNHPNILTIHEVGEFAEVRFIATEFIDGQTVRALIAQRDLPLEEVIDIAVQVASALAAAHAAGIVHRDIKPENIMRRADRIVKILDFGIAKLTEQPAQGFSEESTTLIGAQTEAGVVMGTVGYMSPEQARGLAVDERTDIWSLGVVLYEMLACRAPFASSTRMDTLVAILEREPPPLVQSTPDTPAALTQLQRIVRKTLRKERSERYQTATELLADLKSARQELDRAAMLEEHSATNSLRVMRETQIYNLEADASAPISSAANIAASDTTTSSAQTSARHPPSHRFFAVLIAALLMVVIGGAIFYKHSIARRAAGVPATNALTNKRYTQMSEAEQFAFIDQQEQRISALMGDRPVKLNDEALRAIKKYVDYYVARIGIAPDASGREDVRVAYGRAVPYVPLIAREFAARKVPVIVGIYLPMIESAYKVCYENSFGAKGMFQFLPQTAKRYGVAHEEMCNVEKMTPAAAHYIADRMAELGDDAQSMTLVVLSYNRGEEGVRSALRQLRTTDNYERNFWTLYANRDKLDDVFRSENAGYVPNFFAAAIIGENPQTFELQTPPLSTLANTNAPNIKRGS